jgi:hypothetical protein
MNKSVVGCGFRQYTTAVTARENSLRLRIILPKIKYKSIILLNPGSDVTDQ